jgi:cytochrome c-type biogenesis protein CcmE
MNHKQKIKLISILSVIILIAGAISLVLFALKQNINLFYTPSELLNAKPNVTQTIRLGGYVKNNSVHYHASGWAVDFKVTDRTHDIEVRFSGILPNLFREGQTVVVTGNLNEHTIFIANEVLAKHDEKYMPKALANQLKKGEPHVR